MHTTISKLLLSILLLSVMTKTFANSDGAPPPVLKAAEVAYHDYSKKLASKSADNSKLSKYLRNIANYEMRINETSDSYIVIFLPKNPPGETLAGGGAKYEISRSFKILTVIRYK